MRRTIGVLARVATLVAPAVAVPPAAASSSFGPSPLRSFAASAVRPFASLVTTSFVQPPTQPSFRTSVDLVRLDALILDRGKPLLGLTARDLEVLDEGVPQQERRSAGALARKFLVASK
jgi:hypothetical protein